MTVFSIGSDIDDQYATLTALYDAADAGALVAGNAYRVSWSGDAHVADGEIVTVWDGSAFTNNPLTQGEFPAWLLAAADWRHEGLTGSLTFDGAGRPQYVQDQTTLTTGGIMLNARYSSQLASARLRIGMADGNNNTPAFNRVGAALFGDGNTFSPFAPEYLFSGLFQTNQITQIARIFGESFAEITVGIGRGVTASEQIVVNMQLVYEPNNYRVGGSWGFADATKPAAFESPAKALDWMETGFPSLTPGLMSVNVNTGSGTTTVTLLGIELGGITKATDPRTY